MIGLRIAAASVVIFAFGCAIHGLAKDAPGYEMPKFVSWCGLMGIIGVPAGLLLAIFGV